MTSGLVPNLASTLNGRAYLLQFRKIIPVREKPGVIPKILEELGGKKVREVDLDNPFVRTGDVYNHTVRLENYFDDAKATPGSISVTHFENGVHYMEEKTVDEILAFNNEETSLELLQHMFFHRKYEQRLSFPVDDVVMGRRDGFGAPGVVETANRQLLLAAGVGEGYMVVELITNHDLSPDVCDIVGNSGAHCAAANDQQVVLRNLANLGANLDVVNDEGVTPLQISLLRYLEVTYRVQEWEKGFIKDGGWLGEQWRPYLGVIHTALPDEAYVFDISLKVVVAKKGKKEKAPKRSKDKPKKEKRVVEEPKEPTPEEIKAQVEQLRVQKLLENIYKTILYLLHYGADPNFGTIPFPPLILATFSRNEEALRLLLGFGGDSNVEAALGLTPLHVLASMAPCQELVSLAGVLLDHNSDPDRRCSPEHWSEEREKILAGVETPPQGKTPLQLLSLRYDHVEDPQDFLGQLADILLKSTAESDLLYLGHSPISLAVLRGNSRLIERLLLSNRMDPNQILENSLGTALTVPSLLRYKGYLDQKSVKPIFEVLMKHNANPFCAIPEVGNTIEFLEREDLDVETPKRKKSKKKDPRRQIIDLYLSLARQFLERHLKGLILKCLYLYKIECDIIDPIFGELVKFLTVEEAARELQVLVDYDVIDPTPVGVYLVLKYVEENQAPKKKSKKDKSSKSSKSGKSLPLSTVSLKKIAKSISKSLIVTPLSLPPEIDEPEKYRVCFNCLKKSGLKLIPCPNCEVVYFCSELCNRLSVKKVTCHPCKVIFYNSELKARQKLEDKEGKLLGKLDIFAQMRNQFWMDPDHDFNLKYGVKVDLSDDEVDEVPKKKGKEKGKDKGGKGKGKNKGKKKGRSEKDLLTEPSRVSVKSSPKQSRMGTSKSGRKSPESPKSKKSTRRGKGHQKSLAGSPRASALPQEELGKVLDWTG